MGQLPFLIVSLLLPLRLLRTMRFATPSVISTQLLPRLTAAVSAPFHSEDEASDQAAVTMDLLRLCLSARAHGHVSRVLEEPLEASWLQPPY
ncbi:uncharacterized protein B0J16DRAFT_198848 [Fusarium flagelliforme]|uniref:uncharacterized protein n=1 Tax=Fusarium flagelliforme TaxID=2675880 RepID=UPI001E8E2D6F|nr:uncharacterized protein B0J16DRAFT_198848 [Fusarium flagelliforme]KAH7173887.1 hypothetical protein B0J16DRAFT_198848 [Fusarium flagelliforme]